jgi:hypothetical protein
MAGFPKVRMLELELFQCLNRQLGYAGRLGVVAVELPLPARGSQTIGANCDQAPLVLSFWLSIGTLLSPVSKAAYPKCWSHLANTSGVNPTRILGLLKLGFPQGNLS